MQEISCIKDGITGVCRDIKDKTAREKITSLENTDANYLTKLNDLYATKTSKQWTPQKLQSEIINGNTLRIRTINHMGDYLNYCDVALPSQTSNYLSLKVSTTSNITDSELHLFSYSENYQKGNKFTFNSTNKTVTVGSGVTRVRIICDIDYYFNGSNKVETHFIKNNTAFSKSIVKGSNYEHISGLAYAEIDVKQGDVLTFGCKGTSDSGYNIGGVMGTSLTRTLTIMEV